LREIHELKRYALKLFYIGDNYYGFQIQLEKDTIQRRIIDALKKANLFDDMKYADFGYSGRTDRFVHSLGQVIAFNTDKNIIIPQINSYLPIDIKFYGWAEVSLDFRPRYQAKYREYKYITYDDGLDIEAMRKGAKEFQGKHNFKLLSKGPHPDNTIREIYNIEINKLDEKLICITVKGQSFLHEMVRRIVNVLLDIGRNNLGSVQIKDYFNPELFSKLKIQAAPIKSGGDLILYHCEYDLKFEYDRYTVNKIKEIIEERLKSNFIKTSTNNLFYDYFNQIK